MVNNSICVSFNLKTAFGQVDITDDLCQIIPATFLGHIPKLHSRYICVTLTPAEGFHIRLYGGLNESGEKGGKAIKNMAAFMGYKHKKFTIGAEYNYMMNASHKENADQNGYSVFASVNLPKNVSLYARFDDLYSKNDWNIAKDEVTVILGAQFKIGKYVKIAPNFRMAMPKADNAKSVYSAYLNCQVGF